MSYVYMPIEELIWPRSGCCIADRWWVHVPGKGLAFFDLYGELRPQCNTDKRIVDMAIGEPALAGAEAVHLKAVYMGAEQ